MESDNFFAIKDKYPETEGHSLVIPKKHIITLLDIPDNLGNELIGFVKKVSEKLMDDGFGSGFNVIMNNFEVAGQEVMHAHIHIIPRKKGDGIRFFTKSK